MADYTIRGVDMAARVTPEVARALKDSHIDFVGRYLVPKRYSKSLTAQEVEIIHDAGLAIMPIFEIGAFDALSGSGRENAITVNNLCAEFSIPANVPVFFAVDCDIVNDDQMLRVLEYFKGIRSATEQPIGVYGSLTVLTALHKRSFPMYYWQSYAWNYHKVTNPVTPDVKQTSNSQPFSGVSVDYNIATQGLYDALWKREDNMTGEEIYKELNEYLRTLKLSDGVQNELREARELGIYNGGRETDLCRRYEATLMALRAYKYVKRAAHIAGYEAGDK